MKKKSRRKLFFFLVLVFAAISPLLIAYSIGYKINFSRGSFEKTGGIFVKSKTPRLSLFINGVFVKETSLLGGGAILTDLKPGVDLLRIEKAGYQPWSKTVLVEKGVVTELRDVLLFPQKIIQATSTKEEAALLEKLAAPPKPEKSKTLSSGTNIELSQKGELSKKVGTAKTAIASNVYAFEVVDDTIIFIDKNGFLAWLDQEKEKSPVSNGLAKLLNGRRDNNKIVPLKAGRFCYDPYVSILILYQFFPFLKNIASGISGEVMSSSVFPETSSKVFLPPRPSSSIENIPSAVRSIMWALSP